MRKLMSLLLALILAVQPMTTLASENANSSDVLLKTEAQIFSAIVPTQLPVYMDSLGRITTAQDTTISNTSKGPIVISNIEFANIRSDWTLVNFDDDFSGFKVGSKKLAMSFNGDKSLANGSIVLGPVNLTPIDGLGSMQLDYDAKIPAQSTSLVDVVPANVVFTLGWDLSTGGSESSKISLTADKNILAIDDISLLTVSQSEPSNVTWENSNPSVAVFEDVRSRSGAIQKTARAIALGKTTIKVTDELGRSASKDIIVVENELVAIKITQMPNKTTYNVGDVFSPTGMKLKTVYKLGHEYDLRYYDYDETPIVVGQTFVLIRYEERGVTKSVECPISVTSESAGITELLIDTPPNKTQYIEGNNFNPAGMIVKAKYDDGSERTIANYTLSNNLNLTVGQASVGISYSGKTVAQSITVTAKNLIGISITNPPTKTIYAVDTNFDAADMVVTATYDNGISANISDYIISDGANLAIGKSTVNISYNGKNATQPIIVIDRLFTTMSITSPPNKTAYMENDDFDSTGMVVTVTYSDGTTSIVTPTLTHHTNLSPTQTFIDVNYGGVNILQSITVTAKTLLSISIASPPTITSYTEGNNFDSTGMRVMATYDNGKTIMINPTFSRNTNLTRGQTSVTVNFGGQTLTQPITVAVKVIRHLSITNPPDKINYIEGQAFDSTGMVVSAIYNNGTTMVVTPTLSKHVNLTTGQTSVIISYSGTSAIAQNITVVAKKLVGITIGKPPTKTSYIEGDRIVSTDMIVIAEYDNGKFERVTPTLGRNTNLTVGQTSIDVSFGGKTVTQPITVIAKIVTRLEMTNPPTKTTYVEGDNFDTTGMVVKAFYNDGTSKLTTTYTHNGSDLQLGTRNVTISYNGKSLQQVILVVADGLRHNGFTYNLVDNPGKATIVGYIGSGGIVVVPATIDGLPVILGETGEHGPFIYNKNITNLSFESGVEAPVRADNLFANLSSQTLNIDGLNSSNTTSMRFMFSGSTPQYLYIGKLNVSKVTDMTGMFAWSTVTAFNFDSWNTSQVTNMNRMFRGTTSSSTLNLTAFNTSNVTDMEFMFSDSKMSTYVLTSFNTSKVTTMSQMFYGSTVTSLNLVSFRLKSGCDLAAMFQASPIRTVYAGTQSDFNKFEASAKASNNALKVILS